MLINMLNQIPIVFPASREIKMHAIILNLTKIWGKWWRHRETGGRFAVVSDWAEQFSHWSESEFDKVYA